ncbi:amino acid ABC transporter substrate-binding protein, partial [Aeromonas hydrophila]
MRRLLPALAFLALFIALPAPALIYYSEQNMPLNGLDKNGQPVGLAVELLRLMWREMGEPEQPIHFLPWARGWYLLTQQQEAVLFTTAHTKERDPH